ncbi:MAG: tRNA delta(2)-isopentenylpyrophosphate transferase (IPP transferase) [uncultured bacterium]|nr:MAG: tRNA delta(2)-isopentenylpyrophosphate transferase (IPP transferase) [uncultured bacterium]
MALVYYYNMNNVKPLKIIIIYGPTASGKSDVAIRLAKKFDGEIISADSRQIFKGLDIGAGKVEKDEPGFISRFFHKSKENEFFSEGIRHHLIDVAEPMEDYNVSHFKKDAERIIEEISNRGKIPIICGGTNFWIDSIVHDSQIPEVAPNPQLRKELEEKTTEELFAQLEKMDSQRAENIDAKNKVRLVRAIEITTKLGSVPELEFTTLNPNYDFLQIGIKTEREKINAKIKKRLDQRFEDGMIIEVEELHENEVSFEWMERIGLEYRWISRYLQKKVEFEEMKEKLYFDIIHFAKRQMTWLKRNKEIIWLQDYSQIKKEVKKFLKKK